MIETEIISVRFWASARAAAGVDHLDVVVEGPLVLTDLVARLVASQGGDRLSRVLAACSVLVGDRPVKSLDPATVVVSPGDVVEFLPPFAGG